MSESNQPRIESNFRWLSTPVLMFAAACQVAHAGDVYSILDDAVIVRAREAREAADGGAMFLRGRLEVRAPEWRIDADSGEIFGRLEDPDRIVADGDRARISVFRSEDDETFDGSGRHIEFDPNRDTVRLIGEAVVEKGRESIRSHSIDYALEHGTFTAGEGGRVQVVTTPKPKGR